MTMNEGPRDGSTNTPAFQRLCDRSIEIEMKLERERITGVSDYFDKGGEACMTHQDVLDALRLREKK